MITETAKKVLSDKYVFNGTDKKISVYRNIAHPGLPEYIISDNGIFIMDRGQEAALTDLGSMEINMLGVALRLSDNMEKTNELIRQLCSFHAYSPQELASVREKLGLDRYITEAAEESSFGKICLKETGSVTQVKVQTENREAILIVGRTDTDVICKQLIKLVRIRQFFDSFLENEELQLPEESYLQVVSFLATGYGCKVQKILKE